MARAIKFPFYCSDTTLEQLADPPTPVAGAAADFSADSLPLGPAPAQWESLVAGHTVVSQSTGRTVKEEGGVRFVSVEYTAYNANLFRNDAPRTRFIRFRLHSVIPDGVFMSNFIGGEGVNLLVDGPSGNFAMWHGQRLVSNVPADTNWHTIVAAWNDTGTGRLYVDGVDVQGPVGTNTGDGFRLGASVSGDYYPMDIRRAGVLPVIADPAQCAAIDAAIS